MDIIRIDSGARMSQAVVHGGLVSTAGQVAHTTRGDTVRAQATEILQTLEELLAKAGTDKSRLLTAQIWLSDIEDFAEFNAVWDVWVAKDAAPTRVCVESKLVVPALKVEVAVTAAV
ncbi:MAG: hypothetical protein CBC55_01720 [Gammaproteobacteria bacterium TMED95]|nr:hypothetical protein [Gammaproteobacteria bacterium]OUV23153.1 MAG: hypothetical protein CBC55_01720 [Gammaproteobacteria bacterium TMED95]